MRLTNAENSTFFSLSNGIKERLTLSYDIYSMHGWCADIGGQTKVLLIQFNELQLLSGVIISGNPNAESWATGFNMRLGLDSKRMEFIGVSYLLGQNNGRTVIKKELSYPDVFPCLDYYNTFYLY